MERKKQEYNYTFFSPFPEKNPRQIAEKVVEKAGKEKILEALRKMLLIRNFELRAESAYQHGKIGGFFHSYYGEEAIQTSLITAIGEEHWFTGFYRCHALALLLGNTPNELMAELYGKENGNAKGRGGSMHLYGKQLLGGFAIVGGQLPIAIGSAFTIKYLNEKDKIAVCFLGEGAVAQGMFHEALNLASLWELPCLFVIENNKWGMGTHVSRAIAKEPIAMSQAPSYDMKGYTLDGMDFFNCYAGFSHIYEEILRSKKPILVECICARFRGHSISDPAFYRTKEELGASMERDPINLLFTTLQELGLINAERFNEMNNIEKQKMIEAMHFADTSPWPSPATLEEGVFAP